MYFTSQAVMAARLAALDQYRTASMILLDSAAHLIELYSDAKDQTFKRARGNEFQPAPGLFKELVPEIFLGHLRVVGRAHENLVRLAEAQRHSASKLVKFTLEKTAQMSPPLVELALETAESLVVAGEDAADDLGDASLDAIVAAERKLRSPARAKQMPRR